MGDAKYKLDQAMSNYGQAEKKIKMMDRVVADWKRKADDTSKELSGCQMEQRNIASELFRVKNGKSEADHQLEEILRELVAQVDDETRRMAEAVKNLKKTERGVKECNYRAGEDGKNSERIKDLIDKLQHQVRMYKKQLEEAEDIAANNL